MKKITLAVIMLAVTSMLTMSCSGGGGGDGGGGIIPTPPHQMGGAIQGQPLSLTDAVTTFAGTVGSSGITNGTGTAASFSQPIGLTTDGVNLYVADYGNHAIRKIVIGTGEVSTLAGTAGVTGSADGIGDAAQFNFPSGITTDGTNLFVADTSNHIIRKIVIATREVTTLAGIAGLIGFADGTGTAARFHFPVGITTDGTTLFVADKDNNTVRKVVIATTAVTTLAGNATSPPGATDGTGTSALFNQPRGITTDGTNLYVVDQLNNTVRQIVIATRQVTTIAGAAGTTGGFANGTGTAASFNFPEDITSDGLNLYVADRQNNLVRKIDIFTKEVTSVAGSAGTSGSADGTGAAALFNQPKGITTDGKSLYVSDNLNHTIRKIR